jgi:hypothetical protein
MAIPADSYRPRGEYEHNCHVDRPKSILDVASRFGEVKNDRESQGSVVRAIYLASISTGHRLGHYAPELSAVVLKRYDNHCLPRITEDRAYLPT